MSTYAAILVLRVNISLEIINYIEENIGTKLMDLSLRKIILI